MAKDASPAVGWPPGSGEMTRLIRRHDWATPPGPIEAWPDNLKGVVGLMLASPLVSVLAMRPERVLLHDNAAPLSGDRRPGALGRPLAETWPEGHASVAPLDDSAFAGASVHRPTQPLDLDPTGCEGMEAYLTPVRRRDGEVLAVHITGFEVGQRLRAEAALRESEERLRQFGEVASDVLWVRDAETLQWEYLSAAFEAIYGLSCEEALAGDNFRNWTELIVPEDRERALAEIGRAREGERVTFEYRVRRPVDGEVRWLRNTDFPMRDAAGQVTRIGGVGQDVTRLKAAEAAVAASEARLRTLAEGIPQLVWRARDHGLWTWASPQWTDLTGQEQAASHGWGWLEPLHPDDREAARAAWERSQATGAFEAEYRLRDAATGAYRWFQTRATPVHDEGGALVEWLGTSTDVQDLRELQERQGVMVAELQHRTRNLMGVVRSLGDQTLRSSRSLEDFAPRFRDRMTALARVNTLLSRLGEGRRVTFDELIAAEIAALGEAARADGKVVLTGPKGVALRSSGVQTFAMALHELATNALKYGALAQPEGRLAVSWNLEREDGRPWLHVDWRETGVSMPKPEAAPQGGGSGRLLIERALPYQLRARTTYVMAADGVRCTIALPASERGSRTEETHEPR